MKNVVIAEGGIGRRLNGTRSIITDEPETGLMDFWVDEDDRKTRTLYVTQNGRYRADLDDDVYAYFKVTVSVRGGSSGGIYDPADPLNPLTPVYTDEYDDPLDPVNPLDPALFPDIPIIDTEDAEFPAIIPTIETEDGVQVPIDMLFPEIAEDPEADVGEIKIPDLEGAEGSAITGIDPEDGYTYMVDVDEAGNIETTKVPTGIQIIEGPDKTEYGFDEDIDYKGMQVALVDKDGNIVKTKEYPTGMLSLDDDNLTLPDKTQDGTDRTNIKGTWTAKSGLKLPNLTCISAFDCTSEWTVNHNTYRETYNRSGCVMVVTSARIGYLGGIYASTTEGGLAFGWNSETINLKTGEIVTTDGGAVSVTPRSYTYAGKTVYYGGYGSSFPNVTEQSITGVSNNLTNYEWAAAWTAVYGDMTAPQEIGAEWTSPYSGEVYKDGTTIVISSPKQYED